MKENETEEILRAVNIFSEWMAKRMLHKASAGFTGWQHPNEYSIKERLLEKAKLIDGDFGEDKDLIDVANFAMMLFMERCNKTFPFQPKQQEGK